MTRGFTRGLGATEGWGRCVGRKRVGLFGGFGLALGIGCESLGWRWIHPGLKGLFMSEIAREQVNDGCAGCV